jgi:hypothetical protein
MKQKTASAGYCLLLLFASSSCAQVTVNGDQKTNGPNAQIINGNNNTVNNYCTVTPVTECKKDNLDTPPFVGKISRVLMFAVPHTFYIPNGPGHVMNQVSEVLYIHIENERDFSYRISSYTIQYKSSSTSDWHDLIQLPQNSGSLYDIDSSLRSCVGLPPDSIVGRKVIYEHALETELVDAIGPHQIAEGWEAVSTQHEDENVGEMRIVIHALSGDTLIPLSALAATSNTVEPWPAAFRWTEPCVNLRDYHTPSGGTLQTRPPPTPPSQPQ